MKLKAERDHMNVIGELISTLCDRSAANLHNYLYTYLKGEKGYNWDASKLGAPMYSNFVTKS